MAIHLEIKVTPQSGKQQFLRDKSGIIKCFLKSPPEDGKANNELVKLLSKTLSVPQEQIIILQGVTARKKVIKIETPLNIQAILHKLGLEVQTSF
jgi:uncharacterized protein (TIGR00251 family)